MTINVDGCLRFESKATNTSPKQVVFFDFGNKDAICVHFYWYVSDELVAVGPFEFLDGYLHVANSNIKWRCVALDETYQIVLADVVYTLDCEMDDEYQRQLYDDMMYWYL